jgi:hypothetical protein
MWVYQFSGAKHRTLRRLYIKGAGNQVIKMQEGTEVWAGDESWDI